MLGIFIKVSGRSNQRHSQDTWGQFREVNSLCLAGVVGKVKGRSLYLIEIIGEDCAKIWEHEYVEN